MINLLSSLRSKAGNHAKRRYAEIRYFWTKDFASKELIKAKYYAAQKDDQLFFKLNYCKKI